MIKEGQGRQHLQKQPKQKRRLTDKRNKEEIWLLVFDTRRKKNPWFKKYSPFPNPSTPTMPVCFLLSRSSTHFPLTPGSSPFQASMASSVPRYFYLILLPTLTKLLLDTWSWSCWPLLHPTFLFIIVIFFSANSGGPTVAGSGRPKWWPNYGDWLNSSRVVAIGRTVAESGRLVAIGRIVANNAEQWSDRIVTEWWRRLAR